MEEIKIGFLRGIGFFLSSLFITLILSIIGVIIFYTIFVPKRECISWNYENNKKVCAKYDYK